MHAARVGLERYRELIDDWPAFLDACSAPLPTVVWGNPLRADHCERLGRNILGRRGANVGDLLRTRGYGVEPIAWLADAYRVSGLARPGHTLEFQLGLLHVQEEVSLIPPVVLDAQPAERVLDLCAAPGGKTARIAVGMGDRGTIVANDVRPGRLRALRGNCERLGVTSVVVTPSNGTAYPLAAGPFDRILLDVPCSCEGNLRANAAGGRMAQGASLRGRSGLQATLLGRAWKLLAPGGVLVYSTCTFAPEENEAVLDYALGSDAVIEPLSPIKRLRWSPGVDHWDGKALRTDCVNLARFWPHLNDTGGFTVARVRKERAC